jgi:hypothetical protein
MAVPPDGDGEPHREVKFPLSSHPGSPVLGAEEEGETGSATTKAGEEWQK